jgi:hypothetical protein
MKNENSAAPAQGTPLVEPAVTTANAAINFRRGGMARWNGLIGDANKTKNHKPLGVAR